jgi:hypothetical protein
MRRRRSHVDINPSGSALKPPGMAVGQTLPRRPETRERNVDNYDQLARAAQRRRVRRIMGIGGSLYLTACARQRPVSNGLW